MKKPDRLRRQLLAFVPALAADPARMALFVDKGRVDARPGSLHLEYGYTLNVVVQDYAGDIDLLVVPILAWIGAEQPELLERRDVPPFRFELELLDGDAADVSIYIDLTEAVLVTPRPDGGFDTARPGDAPIADDFGIGCVPLWTLIASAGAAADVIAESADPAHTGAP